MAIAAFVLAFFFALVLGFAAHRASICTVRAVAEAMHARTFMMFGSVVKSVLWVIAVTPLISAAYEVRRLGRTRPVGKSWRELVLARPYRLSTAALVMGVSGALVFLLYGSAGYTSTFEVVIEGALGDRPWPSTSRW